MMAIEEPTFGGERKQLHLTLTTEAAARLSDLRGGNGPMCPPVTTIAGWLTSMVHLYDKAVPNVAFLLGTDVDTREETTAMVPTWVHKKLVAKAENSHTTINRMVLSWIEDQWKRREFTDEEGTN